jgi:glycosyltransferase involved in cell wall biosynthesis
MPLAWGAFHQANGGEGFDIVEATDWGLLFMPWVVSSRKAKVVVSLHGSNGQLDWYSGSAQRGSFDGGVVRLLETESLRLADKLHANSRSNAAFWSGRTGCEVQVIPPLFDSLVALSSVGKSNNGLVVGRLQSLKGAEVLCQALTQVEGIHIEWVGKDLPWESGSEMASSYLAKKYPDVFGKSLRWTGAMPHNEVLQKIANSSFLVVPSVWEVFNLTVLEAMTAGIPVICSRNAGAEMMIEDGVTGFLFDPERPADLAKKLIEVTALSDSQREAIIRKAKDYLKKTLASGIIMHLLEKSYSETLADERQVEPDLWLSKFLELDFDSKNPPSKSFPQRLASKIRRLIAETRP